MVVLEADGFFRVIHDPAREENSAVEQFVAQVDDQADVGAGRFGPGDFVDTSPLLGTIPFLYKLLSLTSKTAPLVFSAFSFLLLLLPNQLLLNSNQK